MSLHPRTIRKPKALRKGAKVAWFAPASPPSDMRDLNLGLHELTRPGFEVVETQGLLPNGYFAAPTEERLQGFLIAANRSDVSGLFGLRGGYGSTYLLNTDLKSRLSEPKCVVGFSDLTALQIYLWQTCGWVTFYGPMILAGLDHGADDLRGYDEASFLEAIGNTRGNWDVPLRGEALRVGVAEGVVLGGCLTLVQTTLGTPWELDTSDAILLLEDCAMKPYQVDRALMHLQQAGKFRSVRGVILGEFPKCEPPVAGSPTMREVCERILGPLGVPIVFGAPVGHTPRPMLTVPLGVYARLSADGEGKLTILEPAVME
jgi:muramoyltetrapeptide carboxypeptidase